MAAAAQFEIRDAASLHNILRDMLTESYRSSERGDALFHFEKCKLQLLGEIAIQLAGIRESLSDLGYLGSCEDRLAEIRDRVGAR
jgi:hypothetical protein